MARFSRVFAPKRDSVLASPVARAVVVVGTAVAGAFLVMWLAITSQPTDDKVVAVYRTHGCTCVFSWVEDLRAAGFVVRLSELRSLNNVRATLHTPPQVNGCHIGRYLGYFVEGHVGAPAIAKLALELPKASGVVTATSLRSTAPHDTALGEETRSEVMLVTEEGAATSWTPPTPDESEETL